MNIKRTLPKADDVRDAIARGVDQVTDATQDVVDRVATQASETLEVTGKKLKRAEKKLAKNARDYVRKHPVGSLGAAFAAGCVISRLLSR